MANETQMMFNGFELKFKYELAGKTTHNSPCVAECPVCHPESAPIENFAMFGIDPNGKVK